MARDTWAYREVAVESVTDARTGALRIRPMAGQAFAPTLPVHCSRRLSDPALYPAGTCFLLSAKLTDRQGGPPFLYSYFNDPVTTLSKAEAKKFL
ncbi:MAG TPA: hypothetical protein VFS02_09875, partial [Telluria sp.]|nr:hypothetical protein [Telluria sp.]